VPFRSYPALLQTDFSTAVGTIANSHSGFALQSQKSVADNVFSLFKADPQKKIDKEQKEKVSRLELRTKSILIVAACNR
jgi:hypothetical protein